jgi:CDP-glucose 4,6-dehydratase
MGLNRHFGGAYEGCRVLLTGHTGFKGSWLALWLRELGARVHGAALAPDTEPAHWSALALSDVADHRVDVGDARALARVVGDARPEIVFHLAAQPLVRRGYREPHWTFATNVMGTVNLLEAVRATPSVRAVVVVTTDKVYADEGQSRPYVETDRLGGHDPYAASKACAELVVDSYRRSFFDVHGAARLVSARSGNVIGGGDWSEDRLVPDCVRAVGSGTPVLLRYPDSVRPWQHVLDALSGYLLLGAVLLQSQAPTGAAFNFGPQSNDAMSVRQLVARLQLAWPILKAGTDPAASAMVETAVLTLNSDRAERDLGWRPVWSTEQAVERTVGWYARFLRDGSLASLDDLRAYVEDARAKAVAWALGDPCAMPGAVRAGCG